MSNNQDASNKSRAEKDLLDRLKSLQDRLKVHQDRLKEQQDEIKRLQDEPESNIPKSSSAGMCSGYSGSPLYYEDFEKLDAVRQGGGGVGYGEDGVGVGRVVMVVLLGAGFLIWLIFRIIRWLM